VSVADRKLSDLQRPGGVPHRRQQADDPDRPPGAALPVALLYRLHDLGQRELSLEVQFGGEAHLRVHDAVGCQVLGALASHPDQRLAGLHDAYGVPEGLQVRGQRPGVGALAEPPAERLGVGRRQVVAGVGRQLDDAGGAQTTVEVVVQQHFGCETHLLGGG